MGNICFSRTRRSSVSGFSFTIIVKNCRFGAHMIIYLTSIVDSYFELMQEYERIGYITIEKWLKMKFNNPETPFFEPNLNTELRNQAGAHADCLLQYKVLNFLIC